MLWSPDLTTGSGRDLSLLIETTESVLPRRPSARHAARHRAPTRTRKIIQRAPVVIGAVAVATAATASFVYGSSPADSAAASAGLPGPRTAAGDGTSALDPEMAKALVEMREASVASRSEVRTAVTPTPTVPPAPPPIVGTFPAIPGCAAVVPTEDPPNGQLGDDQLCEIGDGHRLRADAAATFVAMNAAYTATFGDGICITDSYRSYGSQQSLYWQKPGLAAQPGTSNHGWGMAVDVFCGIDSYDSAEHAWLTEHGDEYGWINPEWAQSGGSRPEPWHWEFDPSLLG